MQISKGVDCSCPNCKAELASVETYAVVGQDVPNINDCPDCGETFEVRDNLDGTFNITS